MRSVSPSAWSSVSTSCLTADSMFEPLPLTEETVRQLLAGGAEHAQLDFKATCNLDERRDIVELAKDVGAFAISGGYIVVGASDRGEASGALGEEEARLFDEARMRPKFERYLAGAEVRSQWFQIDGHYLAVVCVHPHRDGWAVFLQDGTYNDSGGRAPFAFRTGDVFARHGSSSERWTQADAHEIRQTVRHGEAERARIELRDAFTELLAQGTAAQAASQGPATSLTLDLVS